MREEEIFLPKSRTTFRIREVKFNIRRKVHCYVTEVEVGMQQESRSKV
jgi:hypothetical protein